MLELDAPNDDDGGGRKERLEQVVRSQPRALLTAFAPVPPSLKKVEFSAIASIVTEDTA